MLNSISKGVAKIFGTKNEKDLKELTPYVPLINAEHEKLIHISDEELRGKTAELKKIINERLKSIDDQIVSLNKKIGENKELDADQKEAMF